MIHSNPSLDQIVVIQRIRMRVYIINGSVSSKSDYCHQLCNEADELVKKRKKEGSVKHSLLGEQANASLDDDSVGASYDLYSVGTVRRFLKAAHLLENKK